MVQCLAGWLAVRRFTARPPLAAPHRWPRLVLFKPLYGDEPLLEAALASACTHEYSDHQYRIVFGVQDAADPAIAVVERVRRAFPHRDIRLVVDPTRHGANHKIANLINMMAAIEDTDGDTVLVFVDSDVHAPPDHLRHIIAALAQPGIGLVTALYTARPGGLDRHGKNPRWSRIVMQLGCTAIGHGFLPGVLLGRAMGRQDNLGTTMALRRDTLAAIGGLAALANHLADDNELGRLVRAHGLGVALAATVPATTLSETRLADLLMHELRWARTIRALAPVSFALSAIQYPLAWAALAVLATAGAAWTVGLFALAWLVRGGVACGIDHTLARQHPGSITIPPPLALLPLRDVLSVGLVIAGFAGSRVVWRGRVFGAGPGS